MNNPKLKFKTITAGIKVTPSFIEKLMAPAGSPDNSNAKKRVFKEMQRVETEIQAALEDICENVRQGAMVWEEK